MINSSHDDIRSLIREVLLEMDLYGQNPFDSSPPSKDPQKAFEQITKNPVWIAASILDFTGVLSWPELGKSIKSYNQDRSHVNAIILIFSFASCLPIMSSFLKTAKIASILIKAKQALKYTNFPGISGKISALSYALISSSGKWVDVVSEVDPQKFHYMAKRAGIEIPEKEIYELMMQAAKVADTYHTFAVYIFGVINNAKNSLELAILEKIRQLGY